MNWSEVVDFIVRQDAALASSLVGVEQSVIDAVQAQYRIALPSTYIDFLRTMGENSSAIYPFGQTYIHTFSELLEELPPEGYPPERFFKVAILAEEFAVDQIDIYLDLTRSDGDDAPLVLFETSLKPAPTHVTEYYLSFSERLVYRIFWQLDLSRQRYGAEILVFGEHSSDGIAIKQAAVAVLTQAGMATALPDLQRVACLTRESASVLASISATGTLVKFQLGGDSRDAIEGPVRELLAAFPQAKLSAPPTHRTDESEY